MQVQRVSSVQLMTASLIAEFKCHAFGWLFVITKTQLAPQVGVVRY